MPRIPKPQKQVRSAGSSGVKADIHINSPQFAAVARLGANVTGLADQKHAAGIRQQQHVDKGAVAAYAADNSVFKNQLDIDLTDAANDPKKQSEITQNSFKERRESLSKEMDKRGVSRAQKRRLGEDFDTLEKNFGIGLQKKQLAEARELANKDITRSAKSMAKEGALDEALGAILNIEAPQSVIDDLSDELRSLNNDGIVERSNNAIANSEFKEDAEIVLKGINALDLPKEDKDPLVRSAKTRVNSLMRSQEKASFDRLGTFHDAAEFRNDIQTLSSEANRAKAKDGDYANLGSRVLAEIKLDIDKRTRAVEGRKANAFSDIVQQISKTGSYDPVVYQKYINEGLITDKQLDAIEKSAPTAKGRVAAKNEFKADEDTTEYREIKKDLAYMFVGAAATGEDTIITQEQVDAFDKRIENQHMGVMATNDLKADLMKAVGGSLLNLNIEEDGGFMWFDSVAPGLGQKWVDLNPEDREALNQYSIEISKLVRGSLNPELKTRDGSLDIMDAFRASILGVGNGMSAGNDMSKQMETGITNFKQALQQTTIRNALTDAE